MDSNFDGSMKYFIGLVFLSVVTHAQTVKFTGSCTEAGTNRVQKDVRVGFNFSAYPQSIDVIKDEGITHVKFEKPLPNGTKDKYVVMDKVSGNDFSINYFGTLYYDGPYFYELRVAYQYDAAAGKLSALQAQNTYYQGKSSQVNIWSCTYNSY